MPYVKKQSHLGRRIVLIVLIVLTVLALGAAGLFAWQMYQEEQNRQQEQLEPEPERVVIPDGYFAPASYAPASLSTSNHLIKLLPGTDFYTDSQAGEADIAAQLDKALDSVLALEMNGVLVDTLMPDGRVIFPAQGLESTPVDVMSLLCRKAEERDLTVSAVFHVTGVRFEGGQALQSPVPVENRLLLEEAAAALAGYGLHSLELDDYYVQPVGENYRAYLSTGEGDSFSAWIEEQSAYALKRLVRRLREADESLPVGLTAYSVWANGETNENGSATAASFQALIDGHTDTRALALEKAVDFVDVTISTARSNGAVPFKTAVDWWGGLCKESGLPLMVTHKAENQGGGDGWGGTDELALQTADANATGVWHGSAFSGLARLMENPDGATGILTEYLAGTYDEEYLRTRLTFSVPTQYNFTTYEETQQFRGRFDPNQEVTLNGERVEPSELGGFSLWEDLEVGENTFTFTHKGRNYTYVIDRKVVIFQSVSPANATLKMAGGATLGVSAVAYSGSTITATLNGQTIQLEASGGGDGATAESKYITYEGTFTLPKATSKEQNLGQIAFGGSYAGVNQGAAGASIIVDKLPDAVDPDEATGQEMPMATVQLTYANTYPYNTTPAYPQAVLYQLPYGTQDIVVSENGEFYNLRSGKTVKKSAVSLTSEIFQGNNTISSLEYGVEGNDTVIRLTMDWPSPFSLSLSPYPAADGSQSGSKQNYYFQANTVTLLFDYVTNIGEGAVSGDFGWSPIFSGTPQLERVRNQQLNIYQYKMTLPLNETGRYYGCHAEWEGNTLVLRFNHPAAGGDLSGLTVVVDPGHGGRDNGNMAGRDEVEKNINYWQAMAVGEALSNAGAQVIYTRQDDSNPSLEQRALTAHRYRADLFISCHQNSAGKNATPHGVQVYYNAPFSQPLAMYVQKQLEPLMGDSQWNYWNGPNASYNFAVTRERQYPSILIEFGFLSNPGDEALALSDSHRRAMADAVVQGVIDYYNAYS